MVHASLVDRLCKEADNRAAIREKARRDKEQQLVDACTFTPRINPPPPHTHLPDRPIYKRVADEQRKKTEHINELRESYDRESNASFVPQINKISEQIALSRRSLSGSNISESKPSRVLEEWQQELQEQYTFTPQVNANSDRIVTNSTLFGDSKGFLDRQKKFLEHKKKAIAEQKNNEHKQNKFQPWINPVTEALVQNKRAAEGGESFLEKVQRLHHADKQKAEAVKTALQSQYYSQYSFKPEINPVSKMIGGVRTIDDIASTAKKEQAIMAAEKAANESFKTAHPFKPNRSPPPRARSASRPSSSMSLASRSLSSSTNTTFTRKRPSSASSERSYMKNESGFLQLHDPDALSKQIEQYNKQKEIKLEYQRKVKEMKELTECTFSPEVAKPIAGPSGPVLVRGVDKFLQFKDWAKKLEDDKKQRQENAFKVKVQKDPLPYTVAQPFSLATDALAKQRRNTSHINEYPFKPKINQYAIRSGYEPVNYVNNSLY